MRKSSDRLIHVPRENLLSGGPRQASFSHDIKRECICFSTCECRAKNLSKAVSVVFEIGRKCLAPATLTVPTNIATNWGLAYPEARLHGASDGHELREADQQVHVARFKGESLKAVEDSSLDGAERTDGRWWATTDKESSRNGHKRYGKRAHGPSGWAGIKLTTLLLPGTSWLVPPEEIT